MFIANQNSFDSPHEAREAAISDFTPEEIKRTFKQLNLDSPEKQRQYINFQLLLMIFRNQNPPPQDWYTAEALNLMFEQTI